MPRTPVHRRYCGTLLFPTLAKQEAWAETMKEALLVASVILLLLFNAFVIFQSIQFYRHRHEPFTTALAALESDDTMAVRVLEGGHVLFLPHPSRARPVGVIYLPGAHVHHHAYAPLCRKIASLSGSPVLLLRLTLRIAPLSKAAIAGALHDKQLADAAPVCNWVIGGHSLGGQTAGSIAATGYLSETNVLGVFLHASYYNTGPEIPEHIAVLQVIAGNDGVISLDNLQSARSNLPSSATLTSIEGGNHAGFGHYGPQRFPRPDGERDISLDEQLEQAARLTAQWLSAMQRVKRQ